MHVGCWVAIAALCVAYVSLMIVTSTSYTRLGDRINAAVPADQRISAADRSKVFWALRRHVEMFPGNREPSRIRVLGALALLGLIATAGLLLLCFGSVTRSTRQPGSTGRENPVSLNETNGSSGLR